MQAGHPAVQGRCILYEAKTSLESLLFRVLHFETSLSRDGSTDSPTAEHLEAAVAFNFTQMHRQENSGFCYKIKSSHGWSKQWYRTRVFDFLKIRKRDLSFFSSKCKFPCESTQRGIRTQISDQMVWKNAKLCFLFFGRVVISICARKTQGLIKYNCFRRLLQITGAVSTSQGYGSCPQSC